MHGSLELPTSKFPQKKGDRDGTMHAYIEKSQRFSFSEEANL